MNLKELIWNNIWVWRIISICSIAIIIAILIIFFDMLADYDKMYKILDAMGMIT